MWIMPDSVGRVGRRLVMEDDQGCSRASFAKILNHKIIEIKYAMLGNMFSTDLTIGHAKTHLDP